MENDLPWDTKEFEKDGWYRKDEKSPKQLVQRDHEMQIFQSVWRDLVWRCSKETKEDRNQLEFFCALMEGSHDGSSNTQAAVELVARIHAEINGGFIP